MAKDEIGAKQPSWPGKERSRPAIAVALDYKTTGRTAPGRPRVAASGRGPVAEQILALAFAKGIPVREDADLAEILSTVDVDSEIPIDALAAVAEILSYLYRYNRTTREASPDETPSGDQTGKAESGHVNRPRQEF
ncbi:MAG TPA: EscU/YscU/HrcU family type III secretion system export apparatus switch protein [Terriglobia bacterium]|nr:EscU/YscU/HrcU family type III secretion system export apparatus switch protein [Terriglobia bacterium]